MSRAGERTVLIEPAITEDGLMVADRGRAADVLNDFLGALLAVGGTLEVQADRVRIGEIPGAHDGQRPTVLAETVGLIVRYSPSSPLTDFSRTQRAMDAAQGGGHLSSAPAMPFDADHAREHEPAVEMVTMIAPDGEVRDVGMLEAKDLAEQGWVPDDYDSDAGHPITHSGQEA
jgi:hypothetical protein